VLYKLHVYNPCGVLFFHIGREHRLKVLENRVLKIIMGPEEGL
jgi:hypothetical protein